MPELSVPRAVFFGGQFLNVGEAGGVEPVCEFFGGVVVLIAWCPPVPGVADAILVAGVCAEADDFVEGAIDQRNAAEDSAEVAEWQEDVSGQSGGDGAERGVDEFLPPLIASVEPDGKSSAGSYELCDGVEDGLCIAVMMHNTDGEYEIEGGGWQWQLFEVGLEEADVGEVLAE